jgi:hypothetical protein
MKLGLAEPVRLPEEAAGAPLPIELRHLRYFVALADAALLLWVWFFALFRGISEIVVGVRTAQPPARLTAGWRPGGEQQ